MVLGSVAGFFLLFALPSAALAVLSGAAFARRAGGRGEERVRRASLLLLLASGLAAALVVVTVAATGGAPLRTQGGWVFLGWGAAAGALGPLGAWLFRKALEDPRRRTVKAAETVPMLLVMLDLVLVYNAAVQA